MVGTDLHGRRLDEINLRTWLQGHQQPLDAAAAATSTETTEKSPLKLALILGNEADGLTPEAQRAADLLLCIPMKGYPLHLSLHSVYCALSESCSYLL